MLEEKTSRETSVGEMAVTVNGEERRLAAGLTLTGWLAIIELDPRTVAVERNGEIVPRSRFDDVRLADGDRLELVHFVQGG